jgi:hypothetical protein
VERLARYKHSSLMGPFVSYKKMKLVISFYFMDLFTFYWIDELQKYAGIPFPHICCSTFFLGGGVYPPIFFKSMIILQKDNQICPFYAIPKNG